MTTLCYDQVTRPHALTRPLSALSSTWQTGPHTFSPVAVLPEQFYHLGSTPASMHGVQALMRAVLEDALTCWQKQFATKSRRERRLAHEAERWFESNNASWPFAFVNICVALGLEPNYIRRGLRRWQQAPLLHVARPTGHAVLKPRRIKSAA
ncbi:MAG: hypothetical protein FJ147_00025 [Deltaproteobacteria bacterium]|nr:hypothetical protein [Deltaproteobacteria bacterium]